MVVAANEEKTKCRENTRAKAHAQAQQRHAQTSAGHSSTRDPRKHYTLSQVHGICQHKQAGKHTNEGKVHAGRCRVTTKTSHISIYTHATGVQA